MVSEQAAMWWYFKILLSAPVPWIWDLGIGDWGPGLDNSEHKILRLLWVHSVVKMR